jgi:hypothetical protein
MFKSILSVFSGIFGMILKVVLVIAIVIAMGYCAITVFMVPLVWGGLIRLAAIAGGVFLFRFLIRPPKDE